MKHLIRNILTLLGVGFVLLIQVQVIHAQCLPNPQICNRDQCLLGDVKIALAAEGKNEFCEGDSATIQIDKQKTARFDYFIYYWCDGVVDTVPYDKEPKHIYKIDPKDRCNADQNTYLVTVIGVKNCSAGTTCRTVAASLTIKYRPVARFDAKPEVCIINALSFSNNSCNATAYEWDFGDGSPRSTESSPTHKYQNPGVYTVKLIAKNSCNLPDEITRTVRVVEQPKADFSFLINPTTACLPEPIVTFKNSSNQWSNTRWEITPSDTTLWRYTDTTMNAGTRNISIKVFVAGKYLVKLIASNACPNIDTKTDTIKIFAPARIEMKSPGSYCDSKDVRLSDLQLKTEGNITAYHWTFINGTPSSSNQRDFGRVNFTKSGSIILMVESPCGPKADTVAVTVASTVPVSVAGNRTSFCQNEPASTLLAMPEGGQWLVDGKPNAAIDAKGSFDPAKLAVGPHILTYSAGSVQCPNEGKFNIEIKEKVQVDLATERPACDQLMYTPKVVYKGEISQYTWTFTEGTPASASTATPGPIQFTTPGPKLVRIEAMGTCGKGVDSISIDIQKNEQAVITPFPKPLCSGSAPDTLKVNLTSVTWDGPGIVNKQLGIFDPKRVGAGTYTVTVTRSSGACTAKATASVTVVQSESVSLTPDTFCLNSNPRPLVVDKTGGVFFGQGVDSTSGVFNPATSGLGVRELRYRRKDANGCEVESSAKMLVEPPPVLQISDTLELCVSSIDVDLPKLLRYAPNPAGGQTTWSGTGVKNPNTGIFNFAAQTKGNYRVYIKYQRNDCTVTDSLLLSLIQAQPLVVSKDTTVCIAERFLQLKTNLKGGEWTGPGVDPLTGQIDLKKAGGGEFSYSYVVQKGTNCEQTKSLKVNIIDLSAGLRPGPNTAICFGPTRYQLPKGTPSDGYFTGPALLDATRGTIDLTQLRSDTTYVYQYCLQSSAVANCQACKAQTFRINSNPVAAFSFRGTPCIDQTFRMINSSQRGSAYAWAFGDGPSATSTAFEPTYVYRQKGTYTLTLVATSAQGCADTTTRSLYITTPPVASFAIPDREGCAPFKLRTSNHSSGDSITQYWIVGRDTIRGADLGEITLDRVTRDTFFHVELVVKNLCGELRQLDSVLVHPYPIVRFGISQDEGCSPSLVSFFSASLGNPDSLRWNLGNGQTSHLPQPPEQVYTTGEKNISTYIISLLAWNQCGRDSSQKTLTVYPPNVKAFIEKDTFSACRPLHYRPTGLVTPGAKLSWKIIHPSGKMQSSERTNPEFLLDEPGRYTTILYASNCGTDTDTAYLDVLPSPQVSFTHRPFVCVGQPLAFSNTSSNISGSRWTFGDGTPMDSTTSPQHTYTVPGTYWVKLQALSQLNDCPAEDSSQVLVIGNPQASFSASVTSGCYPLRIDFSNQSQGSSTLQAVWDFGDASSASTSFSPSHVFDRPGNFVVKLTVFDRDSCFADTSLLNIFVHDHPQANFSFAPKPYCLGHDSLRLFNQSRDAVQYQWRFQQGASTLRNPSFWPNAAGDFTVQLIVQNQFNCADTSVQNLRVLESPQARIDVANPQGCEDLNLRFGNASRAATSYVWRYDGQTSTLTNPTHIFRNPGTFPLVLAASSSNGCPTDVDTLFVQVWPKPLADFTFQKPTECGTPVTVAFSNQSRGALDFLWQYGDGASSRRNQDAHPYQKPGRYPVVLIVKNEFACADTIQKELDIFGQPLADFSVSTPVSCAPGKIALINTSESSLSFRWEVSGLGTFTEENPVLEFPKPGVYDVTLVAIYNERCRDSLHLPGAIRLYQKPKANFDYQADVDPIKLGDVQFRNLSTLADGFLWLLGDGKQSTLRDPYHEYSINRQIQVSLLAYNYNQGQHTCIDTIIKPVEPEWLSRFYAPNAFTPGYGDAKIQVFKPTGVGIKRYDISVYSPQGQLVWSATEENQPTPSAAWDGWFQGEIAPQGAYAWKANVTFEDGNKRVFTGTVTLLR